MREEKFVVTGMSCSACSSRVEKCVNKLDGVDNVSVNLLTGTMKVAFDDSQMSDSDIIKSVEDAGYGASLFAQKEAGVENAQASTGKKELMDSLDSEVRGMKARLWWSVALLAVLMCFSMGPMLFGIDHGDMKHPLSMILAQAVLLIPIVFLNRKYFIKGIPALFKGGANMDTLVAVGAGSAIVYGVFALFMISLGYENGNHEQIHRYASDIYFESAAMILTLVTVGKYMESRSKKSTGASLEKLMKLSPKTANVIRDGKETVIDAMLLQPGDVVIVRTGEILPIDGEIIEGMGGFDEAAVTGESMPVEKTVGDKVISASTVTNGFVKIRCEKTGADTTISQIISLVEEAGSTKAPIARVADKVAGVFVPVVMVIALVTCIVWLVAGKGFEFALSMGISVLVISCPCALGLATPVAIMVGTGKAAENGILFKSGETLEESSRIDTVVLDKTGTVTEGKPKVTDVISEGLEENEFLKIAAAIENASEHPLANSVVEYAKEKEIEILEPESFEAVFGQGIIADFEGRRYYAGNMKLMEANGIDASEFLGKIEAFADDAKTPLIFADSERVIGVIAVFDSEKPESRFAVEQFSQMDIDVVMLTGDNKKTAEAIRKKMNIPEMVSDMMPQDKEKYIAELQSKGKKVAMIGDGVNDAPALARADLGIAIGAGTDVAIDSADVILMKSSLLDAVNAVKLSKKVMRNIKQNLFWAFFYNIIGIPVAAGVLFPVFAIKLSPMIGAAAMSMSSVCVVANALRIRNFRKTTMQEAEASKAEKANEMEKENKETKIEKDEVKGMKYEVKIEGMMCMHCQKHATEALSKLDGVTSVDVSLEEKCAKVEAEKAIEKETVEKAISEAGYEVTDFKEL